MTLVTAYKHEKLTEILRKEVAGKDFPNNRFYTVKYLMEQHNVSQATLSRALSPLFHEGLLYSKPGKGIFVKKTKTTANQTPLKINCVLSSQKIFTPEANPTDWFIIKDIIQGVVEEGKKLGYEISITALDHDQDQFMHLAQSPGAMFIFIAFDFYEREIDYCIRHSIPYAVYSADHSVGSHINQVWADIKTGMYNATCHIIDKGHSEIAFLGDIKNSLRHQGYNQALKDNNIRRRKAYCYFTDGKLDSSYQAAKKLLHELPKVTAVVCSTDLRALSLLRAATEIGIKIPDFAIIGFDNINDIYPVPKTLTTVDLPRKKIGKILVGLVQEIKNGGSSKVVKLNTQIVSGFTA